MKLTVVKRKDARRHIVRYEAICAGVVVASGETQALATTACETATKRALWRLEEGITVRMWRDRSFVVAPTLYGWELIVIGSECRHSLPGTGKYEALTDAFRTVASMAWTYDVPDDTAYLADCPIGETAKRDLLSQFTWYRDMRRLTLRGIPDEQARRILSGFETEPTQVQP